MVRSGTPGPASGDQSLGDLVSLATKDISQLVRYEIDLAKTELRGDLRRVGMAGVLFGIAAFFGCLVLFCLCFAYAYGLAAAGVPGGMWGAFLLVVATLVLLLALAVVFAIMKMRHLSGMKKTRESVTEGLSMLRRDGKDGHDDKAITGDSDQDGNQGARARISRGRGTAGGAAGDSGASLAGTDLSDGQRPEIAGRKTR
jgi:membrane protein implicated in regulation of membrane protease activity